MMRKIYPLQSECYQLLEEVGKGATATVYRALCLPLEEVVAIKVLNLQDGNLDNITRETHTMLLMDNPNVLNSYCSFVTEENLWVVMPYMDGGSCLHILKAAYPKGLDDELVIAIILRETLKGLDYLHDNGLVHRDIKGGNIMVDTRSGAIKLGDLGVSASLFDLCDRVHTRNTFTGTLGWMAPEVIEQSYFGYDFKADIWSFGMMAMELALGYAPYADCDIHKLLLMTLENPPPRLDNYEKGRKFSSSFKQMVDMCLVKDPWKRPSARQLLKHPFFKRYTKTSTESVVNRVLERVNPDSSRMKQMDTKKISEGNKRHIRGIHGWNIDSIKAQACRLIHPHGVHQPIMV